MISGLIYLLTNAETGSGLAGFVVGAAYYAFFWGMQNGQSIGKKVMGIRVVKTDGSAITPIEAIIRYAGYYINTFILFLGWLWAIPDDKNQGLHDKIAGTVVIKT